MSFYDAENLELLPSPAVDCVKRALGPIPDGGTHRRPLGGSPLLGICCAFVPSPSAPSVALGGLAVGGVGSGEGFGNALMIGLRGAEALRDPSDGREDGAGDAFAVQAGHGVIVSISDELRACQDAVFCFHVIGRKPADLRYFARAPCGAPPEVKDPPPKARRWAEYERVGAGCLICLRRTNRSDHAPFSIWMAVLGYITHSSGSLNMEDNSGTVS